LRIAAALPLRIAGYSSFDEAAETLKGCFVFGNKKSPAQLHGAFFVSLWGDGLT
jgi:hypothetical protein